MNSKNLEVLTNIIGAVESGGQVYGRRRYNQYSPPYNSTPNEHTITIGWYCGYNHEAKNLLQGIFDADPKAFKKLDTCSPSIQSMLSKGDWGAMKWNPSAKQKAVIISLIDSQIGHEVQDKIFIEKMKKLVEQCKKDYPTADIPAQMMYCEIKHLGGAGPVKRIFDRCNGKFTLDNIMASLKKDQSDTSSSNQVGDKIFWSRHEKCVEFIKKYAVDESVDTSTIKEESKEVSKMTEQQAIERVLSIAEAEVGYHEKASGDLQYLYSKTANAGDANYTKYNSEMHKIQPKNMDYPGAWCDCFVDWCFKEAFGVETAKKILCGGFDDYTPNSSNLYKKAGRWTDKPKRGDQAFFKNSQRICHTGIVRKVEGNKVYTVEGNAGNEVRFKSYTLGDNYIAGFGQPLYSAAADAPDPQPSFSDKVKAFQKWLNANYAQILKTAGVGQLLVDGDYGPKTRAASLAVWKYMANKYYNGTLTIGNENFFGACKQVAGKMTDAEIAKHYTLQEIKNGVLAGRGFSTVKDLQKAKDIYASGNMDAATWYAMFN